MIKWMLWGRQYGKTYQTIKWFLEDPENRVVLNANERMAEQMRQKIWDITDEDDPQAWKNLLERRIVSVWAWSRSDITGVRSSSVRPKIAVDNLDLVLPALLGADVELITATGVSETPAGLRVDPRDARLQARREEQ